MPADGGIEQRTLDAAIGMSNGGAAAASSTSGSLPKASSAKELASPRGGKEPAERPAQDRRPSDKGVAADNTDGEPRFYFAKWGWTPNAPGELLLAKGDVVYVTSRTAEWYVCSSSRCVVCCVLFLRLLIAHDKQVERPHHD